MSSITVSASVKINDGANADVDDTKKALILLLELLLVKYLYRQYTVLSHSPARSISIFRSFWPPVLGYDAHIKALIPVRVERLLDHTRRSRLLPVYRGYGEGVRKACCQLT